MGEGLDEEEEGRGGIGLQGVGFHSASLSIDPNQWNQTSERTKNHTQEN